MKKINFNLDKVKELFSNWKNILPIKNTTEDRQRSDFLKSFDFQKILTHLKDFTTPAKRELVHRIFLSTLFLTTAYYSGKTISHFISTAISTNKHKTKNAYTPPPTVNKLASSTIDAIQGKNLFHTNLKAKEFKNLTKKPRLNLGRECKQATKKSKLDIKVLTTTVLQDSIKSIASVQIRGAKIPVEVREGDKIKHLAEVSRIDRLYVILKNLSSGECEFIQRKEKMPKKKIQVVSAKLGKKIIDKLGDKGIKNVGNHFSIKKSVKNEMLNNISNVLTQAKAIPIRTANGTLNFKITEIVAGSIYSKLNIKNDDIITKINGKPIKSMNEIMNMFGSFRNVDQLSLSVKRDGEEENLDYQFE